LLWGFEMNLRYHLFNLHRKTKVKVEGGILPSYRVNRIIIVTAKETGLANRLSTFGSIPKCIKIYTLSLS